MNLDPVTEAALRGEVIRTAPLIRCDFADGIYRAILDTQDVVIEGHHWQAASGFLSIDTIPAPSGTSALKMQVRLSGVDELSMRRFQGQRDMVEGRRVRLYRARFDPNGQVLRRPPVMFSGTMHKLDSDGDAGRRSLVLVCEGLMARKRFPRHGYATDADMRARDPNERGGEFIAPHSQRRVRGPVRV